MPRKLKFAAEIRAALAGLTGPAIMATIREAAHITDKPACVRVVRAMVDRGELIAHAGESPHKTLYSLAKGSAQNGARRAPRNGKAPRSLGEVVRNFVDGAPRQEFLPALTAERGLVLIGLGDEPIVISPERTELLAQLMLANFESQ